MSILERLCEENVFCIERLASNNYDFIEACDNNFGVGLTKDEVRQLVQELLEMIED